MMPTKNDATPFLQLLALPAMLFVCFEFVASIPFCLILLKFSERAGCHNVSVFMHGPIVVSR
ncbi:hypothetical protein DSUL_50356 [Desulfovibrionales bacterium]